MGYCAVHINNNQYLCIIIKKKESMINVELRKGSDCGGCENKYPYIGKSNSSDMLVYFVGDDKGIMLKGRKDNPQPPIYATVIDFWNEDAFDRLPNDTEVVLRNA